jgi:lysozyme
LHAYQDHLGWWTIGVGRLIDKRKGGGITKAESEYLLNNDVTTRLTELERRLPWFNSLDDARKAVLLNMSFQLGVAGLMGFQKTLAHVKAGEYLLAADSMLNSKWATQTPKRANELATQMRHGKWQSG